mmetsp:Transcript_3227/g.7600  ORF Transcript_3227/g.7600 Transcript_3227/m.7600 type:complete len:851 (-) Transcript_3227:48-2600(-)
MGRGGKSLDKIIYQMSHDDEKLINVDLAGKNISDHGAIRLSSVLAWNSFVKTLDLSKNDVGPDGASALATALEQNMTVTSIKLNSNAIGDQGAIAISKCLRDNISITSIDLRENGIGNTGAIALMDAIAVHQTIVTLDLSNNENIDAALLAKIKEVTNESQALLGDSVVYFSSVEHDCEIIVNDDDRDDDNTASPNDDNYALDQENNSLLLCSPGVESDESLPATIPGLPSLNDDVHVDSDGSDNNLQYTLGAASLPTPYMKPQSSPNSNIGTSLPFNWVGMVGKHFLKIDEREERTGDFSNPSSSLPSGNYSETSYIGTLNMDGESPEKVFIDHMHNITSLADDPNGFEPSCVDSSQAKSIIPKRRCFLQPKVALFLLLAATVAAGITGIVVATRPDSDFEAGKSMGLVISQSNQPSTFPSLSPTVLSTSSIPSIMPSLHPTSLSSTPFALSSLDQIGDILTGKSPYDQFGHSVSISNDGSILAIGSPYHDSEKGISNSGCVHLYKLNSGSIDSDKSWDLNSEISGGNYYGFLGQSISLSGDGKRVAVSEPGYNSRAGRVIVYQDMDSIWQQLGKDLTGSESGDLFGFSVSLSGDGKHLAIGSPSHQNGNGRLQIFEMGDCGDWVYVGSPIDGSNEEGFGTCVNISYDGSIVAAGAPRSDQGGNVKIYQNFRNTTILDAASNEWLLLGSITNPASDAGLSDYFGDSISLSSDGKRVAIGSPMYAEKRGLVSIFELNENISKWTPLGDSIVGTATSYLGESVALSPEGEYLVAGFPGDTKNGIDSGKIQIFRWNELEWSRSIPMLSGNAKDEFGFSVALAYKAEYVAVGAPVRGGDYDGSKGYVRTFSLL